MICFLGNDLISKERIIEESERLVQLSQLHDSLVWLVTYIQYFIDTLQNDKEVSTWLYIWHGFTGHIALESAHPTTTNIFAGSAPVMLYSKTMLFALGYI